MLFQGPNGSTLPGPCDSPAVSKSQLAFLFQNNYANSYLNHFFNRSQTKNLQLLSYCYCFQLIRFFMSSNLVVSGLRIRNSPMFHMKFDGCEGVLIEKLSISSPKFSPNTDGIHIENTKSVAIYDSVIANGR